MKSLDIERIRRKLTKVMISKIGSTDSRGDTISADEIKKVLICRPNHRLGNLLLITPLLQEVSETFPGCEIDLFVKGNLPQVIFKNYTNVDHIIELPRKPFESLPAYLKEWTWLRKKRYDLVINVDRNSSSGRIATKFANSRYRFFGRDNEEIQNLHPDHMHMAKYPVYNFRDFLAPQDFKQQGIKPVHNLDLRLSPEEINQGREKLNALVPNHKKTICLFTFATNDKCYSKDWWSRFYERLEREYAADYNFIEILPVENVSQLSFRIPSFYSKDIREIGSVVANIVLFIGADSGIMHLASSVHTPTAGLFSVTDEKRYGPYGNNSFAINTNSDDLEEWIRSIDAIVKA